jgi:hypothetical protein
LEIGQEVNAVKTKYMSMSQDQDEGRSHNIKTDKSSFERVVEFKYLERNLTNKNSIHEEMKSKFNPGNTCCHSCRIFCLPVYYPEI